jgi:hypothetical protein
VAVVATLSKGYDLDYIWKQVDRGPAKDAAGHLPGRRGARGPVETGPAPLLVIDEASTMPGLDLADLIAYAEARDGKVILAGDTRRRATKQDAARPNQRHK